MEYTLTISQKAIAQNFPDLDIKDAAIIDFLGRFAHSQKIQKKFIAGKVYYWFNYGHIETENPLLKLDSESIRKRMRRLCTLKIFEPHPSNQGGQPYFAFGEAYELTHKEVRANLPDVQNPDLGQKIPNPRADSPDVGAKVRANSPDNQKNQSYQRNQSDSGKPPVKAGKKKGELHAPQWMVLQFDDVYQKAFPGIGKFKWAEKHFGASGLSGFYDLFTKRHIEKHAAKGIEIVEVSEQDLKAAWFNFLKAAVEVDWVRNGFFTPCDLYSQFNKIIQHWNNSKKPAEPKPDPNKPVYSPPEIPVFKAS